MCAGYELAAGLCGGRCGCDGDVCSSVTGAGVVAWAVKVSACVLGPCSYMSWPERWQVRTVIQFVVLASVGGWWLWLALRRERDEFS